MAPAKILFQAAVIALLSIFAAAVHFRLMPSFSKPPPPPSADSPPSRSAQVGGIDVATSTTASALDPTAPGGATAPVLETYPETGLEVIYTGLAEAERLLESGGARFIDARSAAEFEAGHLPGAVHLTFESFAYGDIQSRLQRLDPAGTLVVYCERGCDAAKLVASQLLMLGFQDVRVMRSGFSAWKSAGYPTEAGKEPADG